MRNTVSSCPLTEGGGCSKGELPVRVRGCPHSSVAAVASLSGHSADHTGRLKVIAACQTW